jgi:hypothetical protein
MIYYDKEVETAEKYRQLCFKNGGLSIENEI